MQNMDPSPKIADPGDDVDTATERKKRNKKDTIKYVDQPMIYLHGAYKLHYERRK